ncbi:MAG: PA14 domain-containing protein [Planctomycetes bacterium]|nr:PA14 domain-containing protein [Planctomycetota bacterium]
MKFFFCESCGKRVSESDLAEGRGRDKQAKGVYCRECAKGVLTLDFEDVPERHIGPRGTPAGSRPPVRGRSRSSGAKLPATRAPTTGARLQAARAGQRDPHRGNPSVRTPEAGSNQTLFFGLAGGALLAVLCAIFLGGKPVTPAGGTGSEHAGSSGVPKFGPKPPPDIPKLNEKTERPAAPTLAPATSASTDDFLAGGSGVLPTGEALPRPPAPAVAKPAPAATPAPKPPEIKPPAAKPDPPKPLTPATVEVQSPTAVAKAREAADQAFEALEAQLKALGNDFDAKIAATDAFLKAYGETILSARARSILRDLQEARKEANLAAQNAPPPQAVVLAPPPRPEAERPRLGEDWDAFKSIDDLKIYRGLCWWDGDRRVRIFYDFDTDEQLRDWSKYCGECKLQDGDWLLQGAPGLLTWSLPMAVPRTRVYARGRFTAGSVIVLAMGLSSQFRWTNFLRLISGPKGSAAWGRDDAVLQKSDAEIPPGKPIILCLEATRTSLSWKEPVAGLEGKVDAEPAIQAMLVSSGKDTVAFEDVLIEQELDDFYVQALKMRSETFKAGAWTNGLAYSYFSDDGKTLLATAQDVQAAIGGRDVVPPQNLPEKYVARIAGHLIVPVDGDYQFQLIMSGGSATFKLDGRETEAVKDAALRSDLAKSVPMKAGVYRLEIEFHATGPAPAGCRLVLRRPGTPEKSWELPPPLLYMQPAPEAAGKPASE